MSAAQSVNYVWGIVEPTEAQMEFQVGLVEPIAKKTAQRAAGSTIAVKNSGNFSGWYASEAGIDRDLRPPVSMAFYRRRTEQLLRKYMVMSMHVGRCPSVLGNFVFRGKASNVRMTTFEDAVIFTMDMENSLKRLSFQHQQLISRIALQEYTQGETAGLMGMCLRSVVMKYGEALDCLTTILMGANLLPLAEGNHCQDPKEYREALTR